LILGIISIIFAGNNGIIAGIVGLILSIYQQKTNPTKEGKLGIILSIIGIILAIVILIVFVYYLTPLINQQLAQGGLSLQ
jgi:multisubunit Na+/H+ antiporter MnhG subunit